MDNIIKISPEQIIIGSAVKYNNLAKLISTSYYGSNCTEVNLFIDMNSVIKKVYSMDSIKFDTTEQFDLAASMINLCGHYRNFFKSIGVTTNIFIIYGLNCPKINDTYVKDYNSRFMQSYIKNRDTNEYVESNVKILKMLCQYLPKIHFFDISFNETSAMIDYTLKQLWVGKEEDKVENIILTKDVLALQLIPMYNARVIRPYKTNEGDMSYIVDNNNLWQEYCVHYRKSSIPQIMIPTTFFQNVLAMTRVPERGLRSILAISKCFTVISSGMEVGFLKGDTIYSQDVLNNILEAMDIPCNKPELLMRFRAINPSYQSSYILLMENPELKYLRLIEMNDPRSLQEISNKYFANNPINFEYLM